MRRVALLLWAGLGFVDGCAVNGSPFERVHPPPGYATLYVYRPYSYAGSLLRPSVSCGEDSARVGPGGYRAFVAPAGQVECSVEGGESRDQVEIVAAPRVYYIREEIGWGVLTGHPHLNPMDADQAQDEIQSCCVLER
jgi:hypothetical protein